MPAVYTVSFGTAVMSAAADIAVFTVPAADHWILRDVVVANKAAAIARLIVYAMSGTDSYIIFDQPSSAAQTSFHFDCRVALPAGFVLHANSSGPASFMLTGYRLTG